jgi:hypothetical protein
VAGEPLVRGGADLAQPRPGHDIAEPGDGLEQLQLPLPGSGLRRDPSSCCLYRVWSRTSFSSAGGMQDPRSSPHSYSSASRAQGLSGRDFWR